MKLLAVIVLVVAGALAAAPATQAHPLPKGTGVKVGLHKICTSIGVCKDKAPRVTNAGLMPEEKCENLDDMGKTSKVWDPTLGAYVLWICLCSSEECHWARLRIVQVETFPWPNAPRRDVLDRQRACPSIVCLAVWRVHSYRVRVHPPTPQTVAVARQMLAAGL